MDEEVYFCQIVTVIYTFFVGNVSYVTSHPIRLQVHGILAQLMQPNKRVITMKGRHYEGQVKVKYSNACLFSLIERQRKLMHLSPSSPLKFISIKIEEHTSKYSSANSSVT